ncbi:acyl-CoA carboxylase subunit epsilon [Gordonia pseudamarae]|uniref:acyl-CoA carboxylase subunit epsilon n=1 Tax=Gordonia pseudamarae TaxID=2831662 RepID=UPI0038995E0D
MSPDIVNKDSVSNDKQSTPDERTPERPFLQVVKGNPTDEEAAALTVVLAAAAGNGDSPEPQVRNDWGNYEERLRQPWGMPTSFTHRHR